MCAERGGRRGLGWATKGDPYVNKYLAVSFNGEDNHIYLSFESYIYIAKYIPNTSRMAIKWREGSRGGSLGGSPGGSLGGSLDGSPGGSPGGPRGGSPGWVGRAGRQGASLPTHPGTNITHTNKQTNKQTFLPTRSPLPNAPRDRKKPLAPPLTLTYIYIYTYFDFFFFSHNL